jgi:hypothetical protein
VATACAGALVCASASAGMLAPRAIAPLALGVVALAASNLVWRAPSIARTIYFYFSHHLRYDNFHMFIINRHSLRAIHTLNLLQEILL